MKSTAGKPGDPEAGGWIEADLSDLVKTLRPFNLKAPDRVERDLHSFCSELIRWNRRHGLLSKGDIQFIVRKHVAASLGVFLGVSPTPKSKWVDVGTGAGFPGLVLKLWRREIELTLIEAAQKRCAFLRHVIQALDLGDVTLLQSRAETCISRGDRNGQFDILLSRAVADLTVTLREFSPLVRPGGRIVTFKGTGWNEEARMSASAGLMAGGQFELEECVCVPWATAHLLIIRKR